MSTDNFANCLKATLLEEGGYADNPHDPGGRTMWGITQVVYDAWRRLHHLPSRWVGSIDAVEAADIYRTQYWDAVRGDDLPDGADLATFDGGVNSGPTRAVKWLQAAVGAGVDGHFGNATLAAVKRAAPADIVRSVCAQRASFLEALRNWKYFGKGWSARLARIEAKALAMALGGAAAGATLAQESAAAGKRVQDSNIKAGGTAVATGAAWPEIPQWVGYLFAAVALLTIAALLWNAYHNSNRAKALASAAASHA